MDQPRRDELDVLVERALKDSVANVVPPDRVWANIWLRVRRRGQQPRSRLGYLHHLGAEVMAWGDDITATVQIMLASLYIRGNGEQCDTERLAVARRSAAPSHYAIHY